MKSRKLVHPQALVLLATLMIHVGLVAQETKAAKPQSQVALLTEPLLAEFAISTGAEFALTVEHSLKATEGSSDPDVTLTPTVLPFSCYKRGLECGCLPTRKATLTNDGTTTLAIARIGITGSGAADFSETNTCGTSLAPGKSCVVTVSWNLVPARANLRVIDDASDSPQIAMLTAANLCHSQSRSSRSNP